MELIPNSPSDNHQRTDGPFSLEDLPRDILLRISSIIANSSLSDIRSIELVSKHLNSVANNKFVIKNLPLHQLDLFPRYWFQYSGWFNRFMKRCRQNDNPEAIYRKGLIGYFHCNNTLTQRAKGFNQISKAAEEGIEEAKYVVGLILLCLGGGNIKKGLQTLAHLLKPGMLSATREELHNLRKNNWDNLTWFGADMLKFLRSTYKSSNCNCDGRTLSQNQGWCSFSTDRDFPVSSACPICVWHYEVNRFLL